jgi:ubiquinone/menaquinone biosynthesis C-methylase UbiE
VTSPAEDKYRIWDSYWRDSRLYTAGVEVPEVEAALDQHWAQFAAQLPDEARVLDIACGNGAAALAVLRGAQQVAKSLSLVGIDAAAIEPAKYVTRFAAQLQEIEFHANTRMEELPFPPASFDAVISQFGIEYGELSKSVPELGRVLKPKGAVLVLAMPSTSTVVDQAGKKIKQSQHVLTQTKIFDVALAVAQALYNVESSDGGEGRDTKKYLDRFNSEVERLMSRFANTDSDTVVAVIIALQKVFTDRKTMDIAQQIAAINMLKKRVSDHVARTEAMMRAALGDAALDGLRRRLGDAGIGIAETKPLSVGEVGTVAWRIAGRKGG